MLSTTQIENIEKRKYSTNRTTIRDGLSLLYKEMDLIKQEKENNPNAPSALLTRLSYIARGLEERIMELRRRDSFLKL